MKKLLLCLVFALGCTQSVPVHATTILGNPDPYSIPCVTNYVRVAPHQCLYTGVGVTYVTGTVDNTCRSVNWNAVAGIPTNIRAILVIEESTVNAQNIVSLNQLTLSYFNDATCNVGTIQQSRNLLAREEVTLGTGILIGTSYPIPIIVQPGAIMYYKAIITTGGAHTVKWQALGYFD